MTAAAAIAAAIALLPTRSVLAFQNYSSLYIDGKRKDTSECVMLFISGIAGDGKPSRFTGPSFENCLEQIHAALP